MTFGGNTMRPCRFRTNAFMSVLSDPLNGSGSTPRGALHPPLDGSDELRAQLGGRDDRVHRPDPLGAPDVVDRLELRGHLAELLRADGGAEAGQLGADLRLLDGVGRLEGLLPIAHPGVGGG